MATPARRPKRRPPCPGGLDGEPAGVTRTGIDLLEGA